MLLDPVGRWGSIGRVTKSSFPNTAIADLISLQLHNLTEPARANIQLNSGLHCESQFVTVDLFNDWDPDDDDSENNEQQGNKATWQHGNMATWQYYVRCARCDSLQAEILRLRQENDRMALVLHHQEEVVRDDGDDDDEVNIYGGSIRPRPIPNTP